MKKNKCKKNLSVNILFYFIVFAIVILLFLWLFQILSLNAFYSSSRRKVLNNAVNTLTRSYLSGEYIDTFDNVSLNDGICIELIEDGVTSYTSRTFDRKCLTSKSKSVLEFEKDFITSDEDTKRAEIINPNYNNQTLVAGHKIEDGVYLFVNTSLVPLDEGIKMLKGQFIYIALIIILVGSLISYFISKRLSIPIIKINNQAKHIGAKDYNVKFDTNTDILELDELSETLNQTVQELSKTDELRRELMANVSHDLKTPLTLIRAYAEAAKDIDASKKKKRSEDLDIIIDETKRLTLLVNDILELSRLESNVVELKMEEFNLKDLIENILHKFEILTEDGFNFVLNSPNVVMIKSDRKHLEQVIYNLVNNAINYTGKDKTVTINVFLKGDKIRVEVVDTGVGIDKEDLKLIWDKYYKVDKQHSRNKYGTGLGLSIVKSTLTTLNYNYGVDSVKNKGTTFYFEI